MMRRESLTGHVVYLSAARRRVGHTDDTDGTDIFDSEKSERDERNEKDSSDR